jgi:LPPG:FO 2-phospho-L-lactate transferase
MIVMLAGGTGAAKFLRGMVRVVLQEEITVIVNTGDDLSWWGLHVSPDVDTICYSLAGVLDTARGWGLAGETFHCRDRMAAYGQPSWFNVGDRDLATHLYRTGRMREGVPLSWVTAELCELLSVRARVLPMSDDKVETRIRVDGGEVPFQEFFVCRRYGGEVESVRFDGAETARPAPGVLESLDQAEKIVIAPSNPVTSIGPILAVKGVREALAKRRDRVAAISPIIGNSAVSGPAAKLMAAWGLPVSPVGVASVYTGLIGTLVADFSDRQLGPDLARLGINALFAETIMRDPSDADRLARATLNAL